MFKFAYFCLRLVGFVFTIYLVLIICGYTNVHEFPLPLKIYIIISALYDVYKFEADFSDFKKDFDND
jgi:hypothetical protein